MQFGFHLLRVRIAVNIAQGFCGHCSGNGSHFSALFQIPALQDSGQETGVKAVTGPNGIDAPARLRMYPDLFSVFCAPGTVSAVLDADVSDTLLRQ